MKLSLMRFVAQLGNQFPWTGPEASIEEHKDSAGEKKKNKKDKGRKNTRTYHGIIDCIKNTIMLLKVTIWNSTWDFVWQKLCKSSDNCILYKVTALEYAHQSTGGSSKGQSCKATCF